MTSKHSAQKIVYPQHLRVLSNQNISLSSRLLCVDHQPSFISGQLASLSAASLSARLYSICSEPQSNMEVLYNRVDQGQLSPYLWQLKPGDSVRIHDIRGSFIDAALLDSQQADKVPSGKTWWIANGSGVAPFISNIRHAIKDKKDWLAKRVLVYGVRRLDELCFLPLILKAHLEFGMEVLICLSAPDATLEVQSAVDLNPVLLQQLFLGRLTVWPGLEEVRANDRVMLCGSSAMIATVREKLLMHGLPVSSVHSENWF